MVNVGDGLEEVVVGLVPVTVGGYGVVEGIKQQSSVESKVGKVVLSQPSFTHTRSPKQSASVSQSPWPSPH